MILAMAGFDYTTFSLEEREQLALTKSEIKEMLTSISERPDVEGCVYVSTCGRGELYLFCEDSANAAGILSEKIAEGRQERAFPKSIGRDAANHEDVFQKQTGCDEVNHESIFSKGAGRDETYHESVFSKRTGRDVVNHLFHLACGMRSQIYGEDQILTQLKQSLELAREAKSVSSVLDRLFLSAIAAGKKVKTAVHLTAVPVSVADRMMVLLKSQTEVREKNCLVIGNGEIGRLCAAKLLEAGAKVTVTVRNYRTREVLIPVGCGIVDYRERFRRIPAVDVIVSATTSPHFTLPYPAEMAPEERRRPDGKTSGEEGAECVNPLLDGRKRWLFDLALPRDIAPEYGNVPGTHLFGLDEVSAGESDQQTDAATRAEEILKAEENHFFHWMDFRETNRQAEHVGELAAADVTERVHKRVKKALEGATIPGAEHGKNIRFCAGSDERNESDGGMVPAEAGETARQIEMIYADAVRKVVDNLMYDMRSRIPEDQYRAVIEAMDQSVLARQSADQGRCAGNVIEVMEHPVPVRASDECGQKNTEEVSAPSGSDGCGHKWADESPAPSAPERTSDGGTDDSEKKRLLPDDPLSFFPLFLDTRKKTVLIYGAGQIALRRVKKLLDFACRICVISPNAEEELLTLAERYPQRIRLEKKCFEAEELIRRLDGPQCRGMCGGVEGREDGREDERKNERQQGGSWKKEGDILFVVAATDHREVNREIGKVCRARGVPVSVADQKEESTCYFPGIAIGSMGGNGPQMVAGISSEGADHGRTARAVRKVAEVLASPDRGME